MADYGPGGVLFVNDRKTGQQPDYRGNIEIDKKLFESIRQQLEKGGMAKLDISAWKRQAKSGAVFLSLSPQEPWDGNKGSGRSDPIPRQREASIPDVPDVPDFDDEIPFN